MRLQQKANKNKNTTHLFKEDGILTVGTIFVCMVIDDCMVITEQSYLYCCLDTFPITIHAIIFDISIMHSRYQYVVNEGYSTVVSKNSRHNLWGCLLYTSVSESCLVGVYVYVKTTSVYEIIKGRVQILVWKCNIQSYIDTCKCIRSTE